MTEGPGRGLPNRYYDNRPDFVVERQKIFEPMWACVGFASDVPEPGDVCPFEFMELPLLLVRDNGGELRVFHNVCRHRGHVLVTERGQTGHSLRCPYHSWTYALDGTLLRTPHIGGSGVHHTSGFDRSTIRKKVSLSRSCISFIFSRLSVISVKRYLILDIL